MTCCLSQFCTNVKFGSFLLSLGTKLLVIPLHELWPVMLHCYMCWMWKLDLGKVMVIVCDKDIAIKVGRFWECDAWNFKHVKSMIGVKVVEIRDIWLVTSISPRQMAPRRWICQRSPPYRQLVFVVECWHHITLHTKYLQNMHYVLICSISFIATSALLSNFAMSISSCQTKVWGFSNSQQFSVRISATP